MKLHKFFMIFLGLVFFLGATVYPQSLLRKIQDKVEDKIVEEIFDEDSDKESNTSNDNPDQGGNDSEGRMSNTKGGGLEKSEVDVDEKIAQAKTAYNEQNYRSAKTAVRDALIAIELEIGRDLLQSLPTSVSGLDKKEEWDKVNSINAGLAGLTIERTYQSTDKELKLTIANNSPLLTSINMYLASGTYSTENEENYKKITFQEQNAVLEYNEDNGYTLSVPFGQTSIMVVNGINFDTEKEFIAACNTFNLNEIKKKLSEQ